MIRLQVLLLAGALLQVGCGEAAKVPPLADMAAQVGFDAATVDDASAADVGQVSEVASVDGEIAPGEVADGDVGTDAQTAPPCPACPAGQKCRPDRGICVTAGVVQCTPACPQSLTCRLQPPPACVLQTCALPSTWSTDVLKLTALSLKASDATCDGAIGNALGKLAAQLPLMQSLLTDAVANDQATVLLEPDALAPSGGQGKLRWLFGTRAATSLKCNPTSQDAFCGYTASPLCWDRATPGAGVCAPWMQLPVQWAPPQAPAIQGKLLGPGGDVALPAGDVLQFSVPLAAGAQVLLQVFRPRLDAQVVVAQGDEPAGPLGWRTVQGSLCGAVPLADLDAALAGLPQTTLDALGGLAGAQSLRAKMLPGDVDLDGDGQVDAASAALAFTGTRAKVTGLSPWQP